MRAWRSASASATCARRSAASSSRSRTVRSPASAATRTTRSRAATSAPRGWRSRDIHADPDRLRRPVRRDRATDALERDRLGRGVRPRRGRPRRTVERARPRRRRRLPRQPQRAQPRLADARHRDVRRCGTRNTLQRHFGRPAPAPAGRPPDVRPPAADAGPRHRPHRLLPGLRRQPDGLQRQPDDGARLPRPAARAQAPRRADGRASTRGAPRRPRSPTSTSSSAPALTCSCCWRCCNVLFAEGLARRAGVRRRARRGARRRSRDSHPSAPSAQRRPRRRDPADRPRVRRRRGGALRPGRRLDPGVRRGLPVGDQPLNLVTGNLDRERRRDVHPPAVDVVGRGLVGRGHHDKLAQPRARPARGRRRAAGLRAARGDPHPGRGPDPRRCSRCPATRCSPRPTASASTRRWPGLDFMVAVDIYLNETTRHADVILPPTTALERDHYDLVFHVFAVRNTARFTPAVFPKPEGTTPRLGDLPRDRAAHARRLRQAAAGRRGQRTRSGCASAPPGWSTCCCARAARGCRSPS